MATAAPEDWYNSPLYYDIIFDQDTAEEVDFVEGAAHRHAGRKRGPLRVLEPACGSGRLMVELARRGHDVVGFDLEPAMIEFTRQRLDDEGLKGHLELGRMEKFEVAGGAFDLAHCFVSTFKYVVTERGARSHLRHVAAHLRTGGVYLLGFHLSKYDGARPAVERWNGERDGVKVDCTIVSDPPDPTTRIERVRTALKIREGGRRRELNTEWDFRTYDAAQVRSLLRAVPELKLETCYDFRYDLDDEREIEDPWEDIILVLKKRA